MNEGGAVFEIWINKFTSENSEQTEAQANERRKFTKQLGGVRGEGDGVLQTDVSNFVDAL